MVFLIDLPLLDDSTSLEDRQLTPFGDDLCYFLRAQGVEEPLVKSLKKYDFAETSRYAFVHSMYASEFLGIVVSTSC